MGQSISVAVGYLILAFIKVFDQCKYTVNKLRGKGPENNYYSDKFIPKDIEYNAGTIKKYFNQLFI
jgi:hypothetical protein